MPAPHEDRDQRERAERESGDSRDYDDIPGTFVFDGRRSRRGYPLNRFLMSLNDGANREAFRAGEAAYLDRFRLDDEQRAAVLGRDWLRLLELGGNVYYVYKLAACDGMTFQDLAGQQTGMTVEAYARMMLDGGRPVDGNRSRAETRADGPAGPRMAEADSAAADVVRGAEPAGPGTSDAGPAAVDATRAGGIEPAGVAPAEAASAVADAVEGEPDRPGTGAGGV